MGMDKRRSVEHLTVANCVLRTDASHFKFGTESSGDFKHVTVTNCTMGPRASEEAQKLFQANDYANYLYLHGLGVETAEALAEFWHKRMRQELGIAVTGFPQGGVDRRKQCGHPSGGAHSRHALRRTEDHHPVRIPRSARRDGVGIGHITDHDG